MQDNPLDMAARHRSHAVAVEARNALLPFLSSSGSGTAAAGSDSHEGTMQAHKNTNTAPLDSLTRLPDNPAWLSCIPKGLRCSHAYTHVYTGRDPCPPRPFRAPLQNVCNFFPACAPRTWLHMLSVAAIEVTCLVYMSRLSNKLTFTCMLSAAVRACRHVLNAADQAAAHVPRKRGCRSGRG
eukprot:364786-Chlamydomonas_euryale.AAC.14